MRCARTIAVTGAPPGMISIGGYRFSLRHLQDTIDHADRHATLATLPDPLLGQRLVGNAADRYAVRTALNAAGVNPLVAAAFRDRSDLPVTACATARG